MVRGFPKRALVKNTSCWASCKLIVIYQKEPFSLPSHTLSHTLLTPFSHPSHTLLTLLTPFSHPYHTLITPLSHPYHTLLTPFSQPSHTLLTPFSHPFSQVSIARYGNSHTSCITQEDWRQPQTEERHHQLHARTER